VPDEKRQRSPPGPVQKLPVLQAEREMTDKKDVYTERGLRNRISHRFKKLAAKLRARAERAEKDGLIKTAHTARELADFLEASAKEWY